ncbi:PepSY domain-containing protein [Paenibacillus lautus]|uniref:PepSY domain-containing protein n=1 Tax=Paenibacillus lautus TaxID=1401 RepID=UPI001C7DF222|nr:PepSY domain-containing protein [Paenibacillus lautus]MBX4152137.1 PepSY domain-containing protein [Paenibacillus lautus]
MRKKVSLLLGIVMLVAVMIIVNAVWSPFSRSTSAMSMDEVVEEVLSQYPGGEITKTALDGGVYRLELQSATGTYEMTVDARQGDIVSIEQRDKTAVKPDPEPGGPREPDQPTETDPDNPPSEPADNGGKGAAEGAGDGESGNGSGTSEPPATMITKEYAIKLSLEKVPGTVEDVEYRESKSSRYYLVEIERADGREATIQVHAITGKIMTVTWDDEDDDE